MMNLIFWFSFYLFATIFFACLVGHELNKGEKEWREFGQARDAMVEALINEFRKTQIGKIIYGLLIKI